MDAISFTANLLLQFLTGFTTQIALGTLIFCWNRPRRSRFRLRLLVFAPFCIVPSVYRGLTGLSFYQLPAFFIGWFAYIFLALVLLASLLALFCFDLPYPQAVYFCTAAHVLQNLSYMFQCILERTLLSESPQVILRVATLCVTVLMWLAAYRFLIRRVLTEQVDFENRLLMLFCIVTALIINVFHYWTYMFNYTNLSTLIYEAICCVLLLGIQFQLFDRSKIKNEHKLMAQIYHDAEQQQRLSRETIDIINQKCHDLKHQIARLRNHRGVEGEDQFLSEAEDAIQIYDIMIKTGNDVLDTILTEKSLLCSHLKINLAVIADGSRLGFMEEPDIYSLFGNALDNAIECLRREEEENRILSLNISASSDALTIKLDNYCSCPLKFRDGLPVSSDEKSGYHGFGTKSIQHIAKKYGGILSIRQDLDINSFVLAIVFPFTSRPPV